MNWTIILSSSEAGESTASEEEFSGLVGLMDRAKLVGMSLRVVAALNVDRENRFRSVGQWLESFADSKTLEALDALRSEQTDGTTVEIAEVWQQWIIIRQALQHAKDVGGLDFDSAEGRAVFFRLCRCATSLSSPPTPALTGHVESDILKAAAAVVPRMWLHNPPNLNNGIGRMIFFLTVLPKIMPDVQMHADGLLNRFESELGVPFEDARDMIAFLGLASLAAKPADILNDPALSLLDPNTWLSNTDVSLESWGRLRSRIATPLDAITEPVPGEGSRWFDPLFLRNRPLISLPNGRILVSIPSLLAEKTDFEMFWWLSDGPGGPLQLAPWQASFGKLCEEYALWVLGRIAHDPGSAFRPNVSWNQAGAQGEIDALYWAADRLVVLEISGSIVGNAAKMSGDWRRLGQGLDTAFVERGSGSNAYKEAVAQLDRDLRWLLARRAAGVEVEGIPLRNIQTIHPVLIAADRVVRTQGVSRFLDKRLTQRLPDSLPWQVAPLAVLGLEDLETVQELVVRKDTRLIGVLPPLLHVLRHWQFDAERYHAFWQFLDDGFRSEYPVTHLRDLSDKWSEEIRSRFRHPD